MVDAGEDACEPVEATGHKAANGSITGHRGVFGATASVPAAMTVHYVTAENSGQPATDAGSGGAAATGALREKPLAEPG